MTKSLPANPSLDFLKREAKRLRKSFNQRTPEACGILRNLNEFKGKTDAEILSSELSLAQIQYALAMEYGFESWRELKVFIDRSSDSDKPANNSTTIIPKFKGTPIGLAEYGIRYGFRYDPMEWVEKSDSLDAALIRSEVFGRMKPADENQIDNYLEKTLKEMKEIARNPEGGFHVGFVKCFQIAIKRKRPEVTEVVETIIQSGYAKDIDFDVYRLQFLGLAGRFNDPLIRRSVKRLAAEVIDTNHWLCCVWGTFLKLGALLLLGNIPDAVKARDLLISDIIKNINPAGFLGKGKNPYGQVMLAFVTDIPEALKILMKTIPFILVAQNADGGWGGDSYAVVYSLIKAGIFKELRQATPKPDDWRIVREIPAPEGAFRQLAWDGKQLWVQQKGNGVMAFSPEDGSVLKTFDLPGEAIMSIGWWDGKLHAAQLEPKKLLMTIDGETGKLENSFSLEQVSDYGSIGLVNGKVWICDNWDFCMVEFHADGKGKIRSFWHPTGTEPRCFTILPDSMWHAEWCGPVMIQTGFDGSLLDFANGPFPDTVHGLAWNGDKMWAFKDDMKRICLIERTEEGKKFAKSLIGGVNDEK